MLVKLRSVMFYLGVIPVTMFFGVVGILILPLPRRWQQLSSQPGGDVIHRF